MGRKGVSNIAETFSIPPDSLDTRDFVVQLLKPLGNSLYDVSIPSSSIQRARDLLQIPEDFVSTRNSQSSQPLSKLGASKKQQQQQQSTSSINNNSPTSNTLESSADLILIVEMPPKLRNTLFVKRGGFCVISLKEDLKLTYKTKQEAIESSDIAPLLVSSSSDNNNNNDSSSTDLGNQLLASSTSSSINNNNKSTKNNGKFKGKQNQMSKKNIILNNQLNKLESAATIPSSSSNTNSNSKLKTHENTPTGEITSIVINDRDWKKMSYWPTEYFRDSKGWDKDSDDDDDDENNNNNNDDDSDDDIRPRGMPPSDDEDDEYEYY